MSGGFQTAISAPRILFMFRFRNVDLLTDFIVALPDRGRQRNEGLLLFHSFLSLYIRRFTVLQSQDEVIIVRGAHTATL